MIALFDHHVEKHERSAAAKLAGALRSDIENSLPDNDAGLTAFKEAADFETDRAHFSGIGSLQWLLEEYDVAGEDLIEFIVQPSYADILPAYLSTLDDRIFQKAKSTIFRALIDARRTNSDHSELKTLTDMLAAGDRSLEILLKTSEIELFRNAYSSTEKNIAAALVAHQLYTKGAPNS